MHTIKPSLTPDLQRHVGELEVWKAPALEVRTYRALVEQVARLSYANPTQLLFFRGQDKDFQNRAGGSTIYPAIYRGDKVAKQEIRHRFRQLDYAARILTNRLKQASIDGARDVQRKRYIQWSILQHYEVVPTPLLDVTHSLRVACSFAQYSSTDPTCYVYALGLPFTSNRISIDSEDDIVNIRLLSICPPAALRPYFQEGYMVGTADIEANYDSKTELDFRNRLVAKFAIPRAISHFWGDDFGAIPKGALYPSGDHMRDLCIGIREEAQRAVESQSARKPDRRNSVGDFLVIWSELERWLLDRARQLTERNVSLSRAIQIVGKREQLPDEVIKELTLLRRIRNSLVHSPGSAENIELDNVIRRIRAVHRELAKARKESADWSDL